MFCLYDFIYIPGIFKETDPGIRSRSFLLLGNFDIISTSNYIALLCLIVIVLSLMNVAIYCWLNS